MWWKPCSLSPPQWSTTQAASSEKEFLRHHLASVSLLTHTHTHTNGVLSISVFSQGCSVHETPITSCADRKTTSIYIFTSSSMTHRLSWSLLEQPNSHDAVQVGADMKKQLCAFCSETFDQISAASLALGQLQCLHVALNLVYSQAPLRAKTGKTRSH